MISSKLIQSFCLCKPFTVTKFSLYNLARLNMSLNHNNSLPLQDTSKWKYTTYFIHMITFLGEITSK